MKAKSNMPETGASTKSPIDAISSDRVARRVRIAFWFLAIIVGFVQAWTNRFIVFDDGLSYSDMGDMLWSGDFKNAINTIWSPGYPFLLGLAFKTLHPSAYYETTVIQLVNFCVFLASMGCFDFFLRQLFRYHSEGIGSREIEGNIGIPQWAFVAIGYILFIWSTTELMQVSFTLPDMLISSFIYLIFGLLVRIKRGNSGWETLAFLGVALGFGYLAKAPLFPLAFVFIGISSLLVQNLRKGILRGLLAFGLFATIAAPWVIAISLSAGGFTFGKSGSYIYARTVDNIGIPVDWQGWPPEAGIPQHPTRKIFDAPDVFEFGTPIKGTYPPWQDIYYWYKGIKPHFELAGQLRVMRKNIREIIHAVNSINTTTIFGFGIMLFMGGSVSLLLRRLAAQWFLLVPVLVAISMYSLVVVEKRYLGPYLVVFGLSYLASVTLTSSKAMSKLFNNVVFLTILFWGVNLEHQWMFNYRSLIRTGVSVFNSFRGINQNENNLHYEIAEALRNAGVKAGDKVGYIGISAYFYWARLAKVQINTQIMQFDTDGLPTSLASESTLARMHSPAYRCVDMFWTSPPRVQQEVFAAMAKAGSRAVVADSIPAGASANGWIQVPGTSYYVRVISGNDNRAEPKAAQTQDGS